MDERRRYFRIDDEFQVRLAPAGSRKVGSRVSAEAKELHAALTRLSSRLPDVAEVIELIERRVTKLEHGGIGVGTDPATVVQGTNISGSGIAFYAKQRLLPGMELDLDLILDDGKLELEAGGRIVSCDLATPEQGEGCLVRVDFTSIAAHDEETLIQYVLQRQVRRLRVERSLGRAPIQPGAR